MAHGRQPGVVVGRVSSNTRNRGVFNLRLGCRWIIASGSLMEPAGGQSDASLVVFASDWGGEWDWMFVVARVVVGFASVFWLQESGTVLVMVKFLAVFCLVLVCLLLGDLVLR